MTRTTPGPWKIDHFDHEACADVIVQSGELLATAYPMGTGVDRLFIAQANAHLIAAAPDMLAALLVLVDAYGIPDNKGREAPIIKNARAAIAKATGEA